MLASVVASVVSLVVASVVIASVVTASVVTASVVAGPKVEAVGASSVRLGSDVGEPTLVAL
ncbi:hypothetical protein [Nannocystis pusilla]|uniref:hypothetical protein n=1 Tax=Nannocystis pusilla TaxID=889268 RepID=UPI003B7FB506